MLKRASRKLRSTPAKTLMYIILFLVLFLAIFSMLMIGIATVVALIIHKNSGGSVPASTTGRPREKLENHVLYMRSRPQS
mgnify:CR=1 FL=1